MNFRPRFNVLGSLVDCRGLISILPEIVGETSLVKMEGKEGKCERFRSLSTFTDTTINYYCIWGELLLTISIRRLRRLTILWFCFSMFSGLKTLKLEKL